MARRREALYTPAQRRLASFLVAAAIASWMVSRYDDEPRTFHLSPAVDASAVHAHGTGADVTLRAALTTALEKLEAHLAVSGGPFFGGAAPGLADAAVAAKLYVISIAAAHYKSFTLSASAMPRLTAYQERFFAHPAFAHTAYNPADAITGWGYARG